MIRIPIEDRSQVGQARRISFRISSHELGFSGNDAGRAALVAVEMATNLLKHGQGGAILLQAEPELDALRIVAVDEGPGVENFDKARVDGFSTADSAGTGLGAIIRQSEHVDVYSRPGEGLCLTATLTKGRKAFILKPYAGLITAKSGYRHSGDAWAVRQTMEDDWLLLCDGLGHGEEAAKAGASVREAFLAAPLDDPCAIVNQMDKAARGQRGAAALIIKKPRNPSATILACGIGNIAAAVIDGAKVQRIISSGGVVGGGLRKVNAQTYENSERCTVFMATDGLKSIHDFKSKAALFARDPLTIASVLHRDYQRGTDDCGVLIAKSETA